jgi:hypothetical protein
VQFALIDGKDLPGAVSYRIAILRNEKRAREDQASDREKMSVPALAGARSQRLQFHFLITVGRQLRFKFALVHRDLLLLTPFEPELDQAADGVSREAAEAITEKGAGSNRELTGRSHLRDDRVVTV